MKYSLVKAGREGFGRLQKELTKEKYAGSHFILILDSSVYEHCLPQLLAEVPALQEADFLETDPGEESKDIQIITQLWEQLIAMQTDRRAIIVTIGGGVVSDIGGFVAATYKRGIAHITIPTTLVGMVDAALGGKNGINMGGIKNAVGTFHNPEFTFLYPDFVETLSEKQILSGVSEMIKTALVADASLWEKMKDHSPMEIAQKHQWIYRCAALKLQVVRKDPQEKSLRKILNFGHSLGHALERVFMNDPHRRLLHGEAVAQGMVYAIKLSQHLGICRQPMEEILNYLQKNYPLTPLNEETIALLLNLLNNDKKNTAGEYRFVLLQAIGQPLTDIAVDTRQIVSVLQQA